MTKKPTKGGSKPASGKPGKPGGSVKKTATAKKSKLPPWMPDLPVGKPSGPVRKGVPGAVKQQPNRQPAAPRAGFRDPHAAREAERYADPIASREAILALLASAEGPQTAEDIAALHADGYLGEVINELRDAAGEDARRSQDALAILTSLLSERNAREVTA